MQYKRSQSDDTVLFKTLKHNDDLCPRFQKKLDMVFGSFNRYRTITYDVQGLRDEGTDIVIRQSENDTSYYLCFQIKSEDDLKSATYLNSLKGQVSDTMNTYSQNLLDYYVLLCCCTKDRSTKNKIRMIEGALGKIPNVHVIEPEYTISFLKLGSIQLDAIIRSKLGGEDVIFQEALSTVSDLTPTERSILFYKKQAEYPAVLQRG